MKEFFVNNKIIVFLSLIILLLPIHLNSKIFFIGAIVNFVYFSKKYKNIFNPTSTFVTIFMIMVGCSQIKLTPIEQDDFGLITWLCIISVIFVFYLTEYLSSKSMKKEFSYKEIEKSCISYKKLMFFNYLVLVISLIIYVYIYARVGGIPLQSDNLRANIMPKVISGYIMTLAVSPGYLVIINTLYIALSEDKNIKLIGFNAIYLFLILTLGGRINIILPLGTSVIIFYFLKVRKNNFNILLNKKFLIVLLAIVLVLIMIPKLRTQDYSKNYYKTIYEYKTNQKAPESILPVWINLSTNLYAFDKLVDYVNVNNDFQYGKIGLLQPFHFITKKFYKSKEIRFDKIWKDWLNVPTFMYLPYYDFGIVGVILFTFLIGLIGNQLFMKLIKRGKLIYYLIYSYFCISLFLLIFVNHFLRSAFYVDIISICILYKLVEKKRVKA